ncbi:MULTISPECIES: hypothetical protein [Acinetobacter]|uniref:Bacteriophage protein n=1 Tax=Acinetobacter guillouiae NIPH 991 TaxID=1217656 RepID=N8WYA9_ACIGI|nr:MULTISPECIES: hypothetical protein [Acinetobacter]ENV16961.1 hypothetical protein F964_02710 [Acinetobacter guillouiae NIPH 991]MDI1221822.1 hypothetical protein [Acinetobacter sp.]
MSVTSTGNGLLDILNAVSELSKTDVLVGVPHGEARTDGDGMTNAAIGYLLETGSPAMNLPPRPHLIPGIEEVQDLIAEKLTWAVDAALTGNTKRMYFYLESAGMKATMNVKRFINAGDFAPLAPLTIKGRKARGRKSEKPLVDTAQYRNSHTYVVMRGEEEIKRA